MLFVVNYNNSANNHVYYNEVTRTLSVLVPIYVLDTDDLTIEKTSYEELSDAIFNLDLDVYNICIDDGEENGTGEDLLYLGDSVYDFLDYENYNSPGELSCLNGLVKIKLEGEGQRFSGDIYSFSINGVEHKLELSVLSELINIIIDGKVITDINIATHSVDNAKLLKGGGGFWGVPYCFKLGSCIFFKVLLYLGSRETYTFNIVFDLNGKFLDIFTIDTDDIFKDFERIKKHPVRAKYITLIGDKF